MFVINFIYIFFFIFISVNMRAISYSLDNLLCLALLIHGTYIIFIYLFHHFYSFISITALKDSDRGEQWSEEHSDSKDRQL